MKKIKVYIVTYKNDKCLDINLKSMFSSDLMNYDYEINVINNHSEISIDPSFEGVRLLNNDLRPDFSTGHLSRNWNQALINGFQDLNNPDSEIVVYCQNDNYLLSNWASELLKLHEKYSFVQIGDGDNFMSHTVDSVKKIGLWDERFCGLGFQEADYFLRAVLYNREHSTVNDYAHKRFWNRCENNILDMSYTRNEDNAKITKSNDNGRRYHAISGRIFRTKWPSYRSKEWVEKNLPPHNTQGPKMASYMFYPYFEKDVETLQEQQYFVDLDFNYSKYVF